MTKHYSQKDNLISIMTEISKKTPRGIMNSDTQVGHITWQMYLMRDYLKLDGTPLANASNDYSDLLSFAQDNNLITADTTDNSLFKYNSTTDVLTLPNYIDLVLQGGNSVEEKEAGLPNIKGTVTYLNSVPGISSTDVQKQDQAIYWTRLETDSPVAYAQNVGYGASGVGVDASRSSSIYSDSINTVQPPAITLIPQIKYKKSTTMWETVEIGKFVATAPAHYEREQLYTTNKTTITIYPTWININNHGYVLEGTKIIDIENADNWDDSTYTSAAQRAGKDFYIYACEPVSNDAPDFILSANSTVPTGYTADNSRKMGGFHCLCLSVGTISGHTLSDYVTGDILPLSVWDLSFRAESENEGMVYVKGIGWVDIYLNSWDGTKLVSAYNGLPITGTSTPAMHGLLFVENLGKIGKYLPSYDEFIVWAKGSTETAKISTGTTPTGAGGHTNTAGSRIISNYGIEDAFGVLWQWTRNFVEDTPNSTIAGGEYRFSGYIADTRPVGNPSVDSVSYRSEGMWRQIRVAGAWGDSNDGSRTISCKDFGTILDVAFGARGVSLIRNTL